MLLAQGAPLDEARIVFSEPERAFEDDDDVDVAMVVQQICLGGGA